MAKTTLCSRTSSCSRPQEHQLWPERGSCCYRVLLVLLLLRFVPATVSQIDGYTDLIFEQPSDVYTTTSLNRATFNCKATANYTMTGNRELLDVRFFKNGVLIGDGSRFSPFGYQYLLEGDWDYLVGLFVTPVTAEDNGSTFHCQVYMDGGLVDGAISEKARLFVLDGRPPAIPLAHTSSKISTITVSWSLPSLPINGPITHYSALVYTTSDQLVYSRTINNETTLQYTFEDLEPSTSYRLSIVGINSYGVGNASVVLLEASTSDPIVTGPPTEMKVSRATNALIVTFTPPVIDPETMTNVMQYNLIYYPVGNSAQQMTVDPVTIPTFYVYHFDVGTQYRLEITAQNSAGSSDPLMGDYSVDLYTGTVSINFPSYTQPVTITQTTTITTALTITTGTQTLVLTNTAPSSTSTTFSTSSTTASTPTVTSSSAGSYSMVSSSTITTSSPHSIGSGTSTRNMLTNTDTTLLMHSITSSSPSTGTVIAPHATVTQTTHYTASSDSSSQSTTSLRQPSSTISGQSTTGGDTVLPVNAVVVAIGCIALFILIAIIVVSALVIICFCTQLKKEKDNIDFGRPTPSNWGHANSAKLRYNSKDNSLKDSSTSGSIDDNELQITGPLPSESPSSIRNYNGRDRFSRGFDEIDGKPTEIKVELNGDPVITPV